MWLLEGPRSSAANSWRQYPFSSCGPRARAFDECLHGSTCALGSCFRYMLATSCPPPGCDTLALEHMRHRLVVRPIRLPPSRPPRFCSWSRMELTLQDEAASAPHSSQRRNLRNKDRLTNLWNIIISGLVFIRICSPRSWIRGRIGRNPTHWQLTRFRCVIASEVRDCRAEVGLIGQFYHMIVGLLHNI